eukprot:CAMPEP_0201555586 /NCGR_PEP_ID=MMETSP0173_2-20130828/49911_1 /ASSEMBLY_ACC=CAM_ASM_000268 /TAXON_ID=218659 /ORGANISM="Vexillifera sp., Strain DIVA3 564/2" /LENGTH=49 /DNA_ID=CAMNT_0047967445 /DNA_START=168 /DNA_END=317 /DNA_ORIENTATION=-
MNKTLVQQFLLHNNDQQDMVEVEQFEEIHKKNLQDIIDMKYDSLIHDYC